MNKVNEQKILDLQKKLDYAFKRPTLLLTALTHSSYANEKKKSGAASNERLEFLGDSVLGMTIAQLIYSKRPTMPEGQMTRLRSELVCEKSLASLALELDLGECLLLGYGEERSGGRNRPSILADAVEAVIAAMYLDGGFEPVENLMNGFFEHRLLDSSFENTDYKTTLQEVVQEKAGRKLSYHIVGENGPDQMKIYDVEVKLDNNIIGYGSGRSKKEAEQAAARLALTEINR